MNHRQHQFGSTRPSLSRHTNHRFLRLVPHRAVLRRCGRGLRRWREHGDRAGDEGQVTAFTVILTAALLVFAGLVLDGGLALDAKVNALDVAESASRAGAQQLDLASLRNATGPVPLRLDPTLADRAAREFLHRAGAAGSVHATTAAVTVTVTAHQHTQLLQLAGLAEITVHATATARPQPPAARAVRPRTIRDDRA